MVRAVAETGRAGDIALYTGNDDHILLDLLTELVVPTAARQAARAHCGRAAGPMGLLDAAAVEMLERCKTLRGSKSIPAELLTLAEQLTDANAALFDAANGFAGCIAGIHEVLRRQGLLANGSVSTSVSGFPPARRRKSPAFLPPIQSSPTTTS